MITANRIAREMTSNAAKSPRKIDVSVPRANLHDMPIPLDVRPNRDWPDSMIEMSDHIGPYATLLLHDRVGGQEHYIPVAPDNWMVPIIGAEAAAIMARIYGREYLQFPLANRPLRRARAQGVLASIRAGHISIQQAVAIRGMGNRNHIGQMLNHTRIGCDAAPALPRRDTRDPRQMDMFGATTEPFPLDGENGKQQ